MTSHSQGTHFHDEDASVPVRRVFVVLVVMMLGSTALVSNVAARAYASAPDPGASAYVFVPEAHQEAPAEEEGPPISPDATEEPVAEAEAGAADESPAPAEEPVVSGGGFENPPVPDGMWASQLGAWHAWNDPTAVEAAKRASCEARAGEQGDAARALPKLADRAPAAVAFAVVSLGAALALLAAGRHARVETAPRTSAPTMRRPIR